MKRVVITGLGAVTPLGTTLEQTWKGVKENRCAIGNITNFDCSDFKVQIAAEIKNFDPAEFMDKKDARKMARFTQFAVAAASQAMKDAGLSKENIDGSRTGVVLGNGIGGFEIYEASFAKYFEAGAPRIPPMTIPLLIPNEAAGNISMQFGIHGPAWTLATACASGTDALGNALDMVRSGKLDICLAGGTEAAITGFGIGAFSILQTLAAGHNSDPQNACCPFDKKRSGFIMGEGSGILILEEYEHAKKRGAKIYAEFAGYGGSSDAYHLTSPDPSGEGGALAMTKALQDAGVKAEDVQYYNAHGTSTPVNDPAETAMIKKAFGKHAYNMKISSTKSMIGHCLGAAGAIEAIFCIKAMEDGFYPATVNLTEPDTEAGCDLDYVPCKGVSGTIDCAASGSLGFGGHNGVVVFKKVEQ
ncbi:beta-ketoacyl-ACP synthase II [Treponema lecithinolyticum]